MTVLIGGAPGVFHAAREHAPVRMELVLGDVVTPWGALTRTQGYIDRPSNSLNRVISVSDGLRDGYHRLRLPRTWHGCARVSSYRAGRDVKAGSPCRATSATDHHLFVHHQPVSAHLSGAAHLAAVSPLNRASKDGK